MVMPSRAHAILLGLTLSLLATGLPAVRAAERTNHPAAAAPIDRPGLGVPAPSGVFYEVFVRSFYDSNGDGIGDLNGITRKLPYLKALGVSGLWLMPIFASPSYHGYDVTNYRAINPQYGTMADFERLVRAAHADHIKVILDLVANHTSAENPWFEASRDPHSPYRHWYYWATPATNLTEVSPWGAPIWHRIETPWGTQHYMGIFDVQMPDLDYDNPSVRAAMIGIGRFWLRKGADGFRLDAAKHIYDKLDRDDDDLAVMDRSAAWWQQFRDGIRPVDQDAYLVGEVAGTSTRYMAPFVKPLNAVFDFPLARTLIRSVRLGSDAGIGAELVSIQQQYRAAAGHYVMDAPFLTNHDENRIMSDLAGNMREMKLAAALLLTLPGHPFVYYGEEIGMRGTKPDPQIREPMRWDVNPHSPGEPSWEPTNIPANRGVSVQAEENNPHSLLERYRELIRWRMDIAPLRDGVAGEFASGNAALAAWRLQDAQGRVLVVHNLSGREQQLMLRPVEGFAYGTLLRASESGTDVTGGVLRLPAYGSVVLEGIAQPAALPSEHR